MVNHRLFNEGKGLVTAMKTEDNATVNGATWGMGLAEVPNLIHTVLLATDGTDYADQALEDCINLLKDRNGKLVITYFADPQDWALYQGSPCQDDAEWQTRGRKVLDKLAARARAGGVKEVITLLEGYQGEESLNQLAEEVNANMIMLSSHLFQFSA